MSRSELEILEQAEASDKLNPEGVKRLKEIRQIRSRAFPICIDHSNKKPVPLRIPWTVAEKAYSVYSAKYGSGQSVERLAERGGFYPSEMDMFHPNWIADAEAQSGLSEKIKSLEAIIGKMTNDFEVCDEFRIQYKSECEKLKAKDAEYIRVMNELLGSNNTINPHLGIAAAVSLLKSERDNLKAKLAGIDHE